VRSTACYVMLLFFFEMNVVLLAMPWYLNHKLMASCNNDICIYIIKTNLVEKYN
jgi:hypothetical protein